MLAIGVALAALCGPALAQQRPLREAVAQDYRDNLAALFDHFHRNPELSGREVADLRAHGAGAARARL